MILRSGTSYNEGVAEEPVVHNWNGRRRRTTRRIFVPERIPSPQRRSRRRPRSSLSAHRSLSPQRRSNRRTSVPARAPAHAPTAVPDYVIVLDHIPRGFVPVERRRLRAMRANRHPGAGPGLALLAARAHQIPPLESFPRLREDMRTIRTLVPEFVPRLEAVAVAYREGRTDIETVERIINQLRYRGLLLALANNEGQAGTIRFDIDNMTNQEIVDLFERVEKAKNGLTEEEVHLWIKTRKYFAGGSTSTDFDCSICLEEYVNDDDVAKLDCGHQFHLECITKWLIVKNDCPLCKRTGLAVPQRVGETSQMVHVESAVV